MTLVIEGQGHKCTDALFIVNTCKKCDILKFLMYILLCFVISISYVCFLWWPCSKVKVKVNRLSFLRVILLYFKVIIIIFSSFTQSNLIISTEHQISGILASNSHLPYDIDLVTLTFFKVTTFSRCSKWIFCVAWVILNSFVWWLNKKKIWFDLDPFKFIVIALTSCC